MEAGTYLITFERIGRNRSVSPLNVTVEGEADLARRIRAHARPHLRSRDFDVMIDGTAGWIACGMHVGGEFSISRQ